MRNYRKRARRAETPPEESVDAVPKLLELVKNSAAVKLNSYPAEVWLISTDVAVKNILAHAKLILIEAPFPGMIRSCTRCKEHLFGCSLRPGV